jgi:hypothetical protein
LACATNLVLHLPSPVIVFTWPIHLYFALFYQSCLHRISSARGVVLIGCVWPPPMYISLGRCARGSLPFTLVLIVPRFVSRESTVYPRAHRPQFHV